MAPKKRQQSGSRAASMAPKTRQSFKGAIGKLTCAITRSKTFDFMSLEMKRLRFVDNQEMVEWIDREEPYIASLFEGRSHRGVCIFITESESDVEHAVRLAATEAFMKLEEFQTGDAMFILALSAA
jgi:hypothetical protein